MSARAVRLTAPVLACGLLVGTSALMAVQKLALTADGSYFLVRVLQDETVFGPPGRYFADAIRQLPVLVGVWSGATSTSALSIAHGGGQLVLPALAWSVAILLVRRDGPISFAVVTGAGVCAANTWLFSVSETVLSVPLIVLVGVLLWQPRPWTLWHALLAATTAIVLVASYETAVLLGPLLAVWAAWRFRVARSSIERAGCAIVACASAASVGVAIVGVTAAGPGGRHAQSFLYYLVALEPWPLYVAFAGGALVVVGLELTARPVIRRAVLAVGVGALILGVIQTEATVAAAYEARGGASAIAAALVLYLWWRWATDRTRGVSRPDASRWVVVAVPIGVVAASAVVLLGASRAWVLDLDSFRSAVRGHDGLAFAEDVLPRDRSGALWDWTSLYLSLVVRADSNEAILLDRNPSYVPFSAERARARLPHKYDWDG